jgi:hypothetical protein
MATFAGKKIVQIYYVTGMEYNVRQKKRSILSASSTVEKRGWLPYSCIPTDKSDEKSYYKSKHSSDLVSRSCKFYILLMDMSS